MSAQFNTISVALDKLTTRRDRRAESIVMMKIYNDFKNTLKQKKHFDSHLTCFKKN